MTGSALLSLVGKPNEPEMKRSCKDERNSAKLKGEETRDALKIIRKENGGGASIQRVTEEVKSEIGVFPGSNRHFGRRLEAID